MPEPPDDAELRRRLERAMSNLPRATRAVFLAHRLDGMPYREIAERTGFSVRQVERHMARAIIAIDRSLNDPPHGWWERLLGRLARRRLRPAEGERRELRRDGAAGAEGPHRLRIGDRS